MEGLWIAADESADDVGIVGWQATLSFREIYDALSGGADGVYFGFRIVASHRKTNLEAVSGGGMNDRLQFTGQSVNCIFLSVMLYWKNRLEMIGW